MGKNNGMRRAQKIKQNRKPVIRASKPKNVRARSDLPDFNLAGLQRFKPEILLNDTSEESIDALFLALAIIFNDLKDLLWWAHQLEKSKVDRKGVSAVAGQISGMRNHVNRLIVGLINELLDLLKKQKNVLESPSFTDITSKLNIETSRYLKEITTTALVSNSPKKDPEKLIKFRQALTDVRNKGAFHYKDLAAFVEGYRHHFSANNPIDRKYRDLAYFSDGKNAEETRFFYADAAIEGMVQLKTTASLGAEYQDQFKILALKINQLLKPLLVCYLDTKKSKSLVE